MKKSVFSILLCVVIVAGIFLNIFTVSATEIKKGNIIVPTLDGIVGDKVIVPIKITENPGIMAVTISIKYDSSALEYKRFLYGNVFNDYTIACHPDRNLIRLVICEMRDKTKDGNIVNFEFEITENAKVGLSEITVQYNKGDFCNWNLDKIMPTVTAGGINVAYNGKNCDHKKYGEWATVIEPNCEKEGKSERICEICGHRDYKDIKPIGHTYSENWTVDRPATAEKDGTMSRYCIRCDDFVDRVTFSLKESEDNELKNEFWEEVADKTMGEQLFNQQFPDKELTENKPAENTGGDSWKPILDVEEIIDEVIPGIEENEGQKVSFLEKFEAIFPNYKGVLKTIIITTIILFIIIF